MIAIFGVLVAIVGSFALAAQSLSLRVGTHEGRVGDAVVVGLAVNVFVVVPTALVLYYPDYGLTPVSIASFVAAGLVGTLLGRVFYFGGIAKAGASRAEAIKASQSFNAALLAVIVVGETLTMAHLGAIVLIVLGLALLATESADDPLTGEKIGWVALAYPLAGAFFFGLEPVLAKVGFAEGTPTLVALSLKVTAAGVGFLAYLAYRDELPTRRSVGSNLRWFLAAGVANTTFIVAYYTGLSVSPVNVVVPIIQTSPLLVVVASAFLLRRHERVSPRLVVAAVVVVAGAIGVTVFG